MLDQLAHLGVAGHLGLALDLETLLAAPGAYLVKQRHHQRAGVLAAVADHHHLVDVGRFLELVLDHLRGDVLAAAGLEHFLLAVGDAQVAAGVDLADVAGVQPAVLERFAGHLLVLVIAHHHVGPAGEDFTVFGNADLDVVERNADGADVHLVGVQLVAGQDRSGFGHAVAFGHHDAGSPEHARKARLQGGRADHDDLDLVAHGGTPLAVDELVVQLVLQGSQSLGRGVGLEGFGKAQRRFVELAGHALEFVALGDELFVYLFQEARHGGEHLRMHVLQAGGNDVHALGVVDADAGADVEVAGGPLEHVRQRQEAHRAPLARYQRLDEAADRFHLADHVAVAQHHALGTAGGAGGVDDGQEVVRTHRVAQCCQYLGIAVATGHQEFFPVGGAFDVFEGVDRAVHALGGILELAVQGLVAGKGQPDFCVLHDETHVVERQRRVQRHADGADLLQGKVDEMPLGTVVGNQGNGIAATDAELEQPLAQAVDDFQDFLRVETLPVFPLACTQAVGLGVVRKLVTEEVKNALVGHS